MRKAFRNFAYRLHAFPFTIYVHLYVFERDILFIYISRKKEKVFDILCYYIPYNNFI